MTVYTAFSVLTSIYSNTEPHYYTGIDRSRYEGSALKQITAEQPVRRHTERKDEVTAP